MGEESAEMFQLSGDNLARFFFYTRRVDLNEVHILSHLVCRVTRML